jgi:adenylate kinase family enzyme
MNKIMIIGPPGAGKSTLAHELGEILQIEVIHLDRLFWQNGWKEKPEKKWIQYQFQLVQKDAWIMDGSYHGTLDIRLIEADTIIFLDMPRLLCLWRVVKRHFTAPLRPDLPKQCRDKLDRTYLMKVWSFPTHDRADLIEQVQKERAHPQKTEKEVIWLDSRKEVSRFLQEVRKQVLEEKRQSAENALATAKI